MLFAHVKSEPSRFWASSTGSRTLLSKLQGPEGPTTLRSEKQKGTFQAQLSRRDGGRVWKGFIPERDHAYGHQGATSHRAMGPAACSRDSNTNGSFIGFVVLSPSQLSSLCLKTIADSRHAYLGPIPAVKRSSASPPPSSR